MLLGIIRQCLKRKKQIADIRTDDITVEIDISKEYHRVPWKRLIVNKVLMNNNPIINIVHMENWMNVMECLKDFLIIEEIVMATISKIITTNIDLLMTDTVAEMMQGLTHIVGQNLLLQMIFRHTMKTIIEWNQDIIISHILKYIYPVMNIRLIYHVIITVCLCNTVNSQMILLK
jgi:hypothetical protein